MEQFAFVVRVVEGFIENYEEVKALNEGLPEDQRLTQQFSDSVIESLRTIRDNLLPFIPPEEQTTSPEGQTPSLLEG